MFQNARIRYYTRKELQAIFVIVRYKEMKTFFFQKGNFRVKRCTSAFTQEGPV